MVFRAVLQLVLVLLWSLNAGLVIMFNKPGSGMCADFVNNSVVIILALFLL